MQREKESANSSKDQDGGPLEGSHPCIRKGPHISLFFLVGDMERGHDQLYDLDNL